MNDFNTEPDDLSHKTIEILFQKQIIMLSRRTFSDNCGFLGA